MQRLAIIVAILLLVSRAWGQFTQINTGFMAMGDFSVCQWVDLNMDGRLDVVMSGHTMEVGRATRAYLNNGQDNFTFVPNSFPIMTPYYLECGDYNLDGRPDIALTGTPQQMLAIQQGSGDGSFRNWYSNDSPTSTASSLNCADLDNDGSEDVILDNHIYYITAGHVSGFGYLYPPSPVDAVEFADYDRDGDADALIHREGSTDVSVKLLRNDGNRTFTEVISLPGAYGISYCWVDYDNDGDKDIFLRGRTSYNGNQYITHLYRNDGNNVFTEVQTGITGWGYGTMDWGDYDNDGDADLLMTASAQDGTYHVLLYRNDGNGVFTSITTGLPGVNGDAKWGDYDNDGDLDILLCGSSSEAYVAGIWRNDGTVHNAAPLTPVLLQSRIEGDYLCLSWAPVQDNETPQAALSYNVRIGSVSGRSNVASSLSNAEGSRLLTREGNAGSNCFYKIKLSALTAFHQLFWSVQTVDGAYRGSAFAPEQSLLINDAVLAPAGGEQLRSGNAFNIHWIMNTSVSNVNIHLSTDGGVSWTLLNTSPVSASLHSFRTTMPLVNSSNCLVKVEDAAHPEMYCVSKSSFSLYADAPYLYLEDVNSKLQTGQTCELHWQSTGVDSVDVEYNLNGNLDWVVIATGVDASAHGYRWLVPDIITDQCFLRIRQHNNTSVFSWNNKFVSTCSITLLAPVAGQMWVVGDNCSISVSSANINHVLLKYSADAGANWSTIGHYYVSGAGLNPYNYTYHWTLPNVSSDSLLIWAGNYDDTSIFDLSDGFAYRPQITVLSPNRQGLLLHMSEPYLIKWDSQNVSGTLCIEFTRDGGQSYYTVATGVSASQNQYEWVVFNYSNLTGCYMRVRSEQNSNVYGMASFPFTVANMWLRSPLGGEVWGAGTSHQVQFSVHNLSGLQLDFSPDDGTTWQPIHYQSNMNYQGYTYTLPNIYSTHCRYRVYDPQHPDFYDISDSCFSIVPAIEVAAPRAGTEYLGGQSCPILWRCTEELFFVHLYYAVEGTESWMPILANYPAQTGRYDWIIPRYLPTGNYKIRVLSTNSLLDSSSAFHISNLSSAPLAVSLHIAGNDVLLSWEEPATKPACYEVSYSTKDTDTTHFTFLDRTMDCRYLHKNIISSASRCFYQVTPVYDSPPIKPRDIVLPGGE